MSFSAFTLLSLHRSLMDRALLGKKSVEVEEIFCIITPCEYSGFFFVFLFFKG